MQIQDLFKFIFQSTSGCEHLVSSQEDAIRYIKNEYENYISVKDNPEVKKLEKLKKQLDNPKYFSDIIKNNKFVRFAV